MEREDYIHIINTLIGQIEEGVYIVDQDGTGLFYNKAMAAMEEIEVDDVIGKLFHKAFPGIGLNESTMYQALKKGVSTKNKKQTYTNLYGKSITRI